MSLEDTISFAWTYWVTSLSESESESHCDWRSVSRPVFCSWPDISYSLTATVLSLWGAPSDEGTGLSFVRLIVNNNVSTSISCYLLSFYCLGFKFSLFLILVLVLVPVLALV
jgi:hypothetical protein